MYCTDKDLSTFISKEVDKIDPGIDFRSRVLDQNNIPTTEVGADLPWEGNLPKKKALTIPKFEDILALFARKCTISVLIEDEDEILISSAIELIEKYGVTNRVRIIAVGERVFRKIHSESPDSFLVYYGSPEELDQAKKLGASIFCLDYRYANLITGTEGMDIIISYGLTENNPNYPVAPTRAFLKSLSEISIVKGIISPAVLPSVEAITPVACLFEDDFKGQSINKNKWAAGYSHINQDTEIFQDDGIHIKIKDGGTYSGAAAVCLLPLHNRFDVQVDFYVGNPQQGTTFEMAAICIDPGYHNIDNTNLNSKKVNLTFDVHGAPPYASSERDEDDGFRCGWNNGYSLTKIDPDWTAASVNMYNKYGRDVGNGAANNPNGTLRLIRNGTYFASYYLDKYNNAWVCSGAMMVQNMSNDVYIRIAAKHWNKTGHPPVNHVCFNNFRVFQF